MLRVTSDTGSIVPIELDRIEPVVSGVIDYFSSCSNFRRGSDVIKGLAFGASLVGVCRPILYGLAADGRAGVTGTVSGITTELKRIMGLVGAAEPGAVTKEILIKG